MKFTLLQLVQVRLTAGWFDAIIISFSPKRVRVQLMQTGEIIQRRFRDVR